MGQGDSDQQSKPAGLINYFVVDYSYNCFYLDSNFKRGSSQVAILCDMHSLMPVGLFMFLSMNDFLPECLFAVVVIKCFMIGVNV